MCSSDLRPDSTSSPYAMAIARDSTAGASGTGLRAPCAVGVGACARTGTIVCNAAQTGTTCSVTAGTPTTEICNNIDDDCDGMVDEGVTQSCYAGPAGTSGVGICRPGTQTCAAGVFGACTGQVLPAAEVCDNVDNDCNGTVDNGLKIGRAHV